MGADEYIGTPETVETVLERAKAEGVELGTWCGRVTARGCSPVLLGLIKQFEPELVERLGDKYHVAWD